MIIRYNDLVNEYSNYKNIDSKIKSVIEKEKLIKVIRGLYETDINVNPIFLSHEIINNSYISFEYALFFYNYIIDYPLSITSASLNIRKNKEFKTESFGSFTYTDIPSSVFDLYLYEYKENGYTYKIAKIEKVILDLLYKKDKLNNYTELEDYLYKELKLSNFIYKLDLDILFEIGYLYHSRNIDLFLKYIINKEKLNNGSLFISNTSSSVLKNISIPDIENERVNKINNENKRNESFYSLKLLSYSISKNDYILDRNENGKPYLLNDLYFNISNSKGNISLALLDSEIGLDIEYNREIKNVNSLIKRVMNDIDIEAINKGVPFLKIWTIKEAFTKYLGSGISFDLKNIIIDYKNHLITYNKMCVNYFSIFYENLFISIVSEKKTYYTIRKLR